MILLIDIGNSRIKIAAENNGQLEMYEALNYVPSQILKQFSNKIDELISSPPTTILISNVAGPDIDKDLCQWSESKFQLTPIFAVVNDKLCGLVNAYSQPEKLGIDRWLAMIAASNCFSGPICVVDCGTAVTIDAIDDKKYFLGGVILPGIQVMRQSLIENTHAIGGNATGHIGDVFARDTQQGVSTGSILAIVATIELVVKKLEERTDQKVSCILTGGDAALIQTNMTIPTTLKTDLVFHGLILWGKENGLV